MFLHTMKIQKDGHHQDAQFSFFRKLMHVIVTLQFVRILCILVTDGRMVEFNSSICQERHEDTGQMEDHLKPLSHLSHTPIYERIPILPFVNEHSPIWQSTICLCSALTTSKDIWIAQNTTKISGV